MLPLGTDDPREIGEFRLQARLGAGGMGRVFLASSPGGRAVAVKVVHPHLARDAVFLGRFRHEVDAARAVNGGYAAPVIAAGPDDDPPWLATAYIPGPSLQEVVAATGPLPEDAARKLSAGVAEALRAIHACGLVHRDLKPGNVLLAADGPRVVDFGIARALDGTVLTAAETELDTPSFMSPEQAQGLPTGPASDVFSLGGVVYFAATGDGPFGTGLPAVMLYRIVHTEPDLERLPPGLRELAGDCLAKEPARRPAVAELATALKGSAPPQGSAAGFWPAPVAQLIADHQSQPAQAPAAEPPPAEEPHADEPHAEEPAAEVPAAEVPGEPPPAEPLPAEALPEVRPAEELPGAAASRPAAGDEPVPGTGPARDHEPAPRTDPPPARRMGRRRVLAALAGVAAGGLAAAGWELTRPGPASATRRLAVSHAAKPRRPGAEIWSHPVGSPVAAVAAAGPAVFAGTGENSVYALDAATGALIWGREGTHAGTDQLVLAGSNVVIGDRIGGGVYALEAATGGQRWSVSSGAVLGLVAADGVVYAGVAVNSGATGGVMALSADSGQLLWTAGFGKNRDADGGLAVSGGVVYVTTSDGEIYAFRAASGRRLWRIAGRNVTFGPAPPVAAGGVVFACSANKIPVLYAVHAATGRGLWQRSLGAAAFPAYLDVADGVVFAGLTRINGSAGPNAGGLTARNAATGQLLWRAPVAGGVDLAPAVASGVAYTGSNNGVLDAWQAGTGIKLWSFSTAGLIGTNIAVGRDVVYFGSSDNRVYAVAAQPPGGSGSSPAAPLPGGPGSARIIEYAEYRPSG